MAKAKLPVALDGEERTKKLRAEILKAGFTFALVETFLLAAVAVGNDYNDHKIYAILDPNKPVDGKLQSLVNAVLTLNTYQGLSITAASATITMFKHAYDRYKANITDDKSKLNKRFVKKDGQLTLE